jgi:beta-lactamase regulating signal transducer with metallopeptidase domain
MMLSLGKHLLESTIFALFIGALTLMLRRRGPATRHMLWLLAAATFLLPGETISLLGSKLAQLLPTSHVSQSLPMVLAPWVAPSTISVPPQTADTGVLNYVLLLVWLLGCVLMLTAWLPKLWTAPHFSDSRDNGLHESLQRLQQRLGLRQAVTLRFSDSIAEPALVGFRKPIIVLPTGLAAKLSAAELESVVLHELAHAKRRDNWTAAFSHVMTCIFWFYPLLWWIERRLRRERELACDEIVVRYGAAPGDYVAGILKVCRLQLCEGVAGVSGVCRSNLKDRMEAIMSFSAERMSRPAPKALLGGLVAAVFIVPILIGFFFAPARSAARVLDQSSFAGTWEGKMQNLPGVELKLDETGGKVTGTVAFYLLGRSKVNESLHESGKQYSAPLLVPHMDGKILTFEVQRKKCEGCTELTPNAKFRMELTGPNEARLWNLTENSKGAGLELVRSIASNIPVAYTSIQSVDDRQSKSAEPMTCIFADARYPEGTVIKEGDGPEQMCARVVVAGIKRSSGPPMYFAEWIRTSEALRRRSATVVRLAAPPLFFCSPKPPTGKGGCSCEEGGPFSSGAWVNSAKSQLQLRCEDSKWVQTETRNAQQK